MEDKVCLHIRHLNFLASMHAFKMSSNFEKLVRWASRQNTEKLDDILRVYNHFDSRWKNEFWKLTLKESMEKAKDKLVRLQNIINSTIHGGFAVTTKGGMKCTIQRLDKTPLVKLLEAEAKKAESDEKRLERRLDYIHYHYAFETFVFTFEKDDASFGILYHVDTNSSRAPIILLKIIDAVQCGKLSIACRTGREYVFINNTLHKMRYHSETSCDYATIIIKAVKNNVSPAISIMLNPPGE